MENKEHFVWTMTWLHHRENVSIFGKGNNERKIWADVKRNKERNNSQKNWKLWKKNEQERDKESEIEQSKRENVHHLKKENNERMTWVDDEIRKDWKKIENS